MKEEPKYIHNTLISEIQYDENDQLFHMFREIAYDVDWENLSDEDNEALLRGVTTSHKGKQVALPLHQTLTKNSVYKKNKKWNEYREDIDEQLEIMGNKVWKFYEDIGRGPETPQFDLLLSGFWINRLTEGDYNHLHNHNNATISGVYYVEVPDVIKDADYMSNKFPDGYLCLLGNSIGMVERNIIGDNNYYLKPKEGLMILFPASVQHMVYPFKGPGTRIAIAFNLSLVVADKYYSYKTF